MDTAQLVTGNFTLTAQMASGKSMNISGYAYEGESVESLNQRISLMHDALDFQRRRAEIPELEHKRDILAQQIETMGDALRGLKGKGAKLTRADLQQVRNLETSMRKASEDLIKGEEAIDKAKADVGVK